MDFNLDFETTLELFGYGCIFFVAFSTIKDILFDYSKTVEDMPKFYKKLNRDNMLGGLGVMSLLYLAIIDHSYPQIGLLTISFIYNIYNFWERNKRLREERE